MAFDSRKGRDAHPDEVLAEAIAAEPQPVVLLAGGVDRAGVEPWYVEHALAALTTKALGDASRDFNVDRLRAEEAGSDVVIGRAETLPVMAKRRVVAVSDIDRWKAGEHERILAYLKNPSKSTVLLLASSKLDRRTNFAKTIEGLKQVWRFRKLERPELAKVLTARARKEGKKLAPAAAEEMVVRAGEDLRLLLTELMKLVAFVGDKETIGEEDVAVATAGAGMSDVFAYADSLGRGDLGRSLERLQIMLDGGTSAFELIGGLAWHFRTLIRVKNGAPAFGPNRDAMAAAARAFPPRALVAAHREIYRADVSLKAAQGPTGLKDEAVMDRLTRRICSLRHA
jgi:DNA polymerase III delta subunit